MARLQPFGWDFTHAAYMGPLPVRENEGGCRHRNQITSLMSGYIEVPLNFSSLWAPWQSQHLDTRCGNARWQTKLDKFRSVFALFLPTTLLPLFWLAGRSSILRTTWLGVGCEGIIRKDGAELSRPLYCLFQAWEREPRGGWHFRLGVKSTLWFRFTWTF